MLSFLSFKDVPCQDVDVLISAIKVAFEDRELKMLLTKSVFLPSDGIKVNSNLRVGIAAKFLNKHSLPWLRFISCLAHRLEVAFGDSFKNHLST